MFARYVEVLLAMEPSPRRNQLLERALAFVESMLASADDDVGNLAYVGLYEGRPVVVCPGRPVYRAAGRGLLDRYEQGWRQYVGTEMHPTEQEKARMYDRFGVRLVIASEMAIEGVTLEAIPGVTYGDDQSI